jgi:predicted secreted Zn-dependent protease
MRRTTIDFSANERGYRVLGSTREDLASGIALLGPKIAGRAFGAVTHWRIGWSHAAVACEGGFRIADAAIIVRVELTLPEWRPPLHADGSVVLGFRRYRAGLRAHERGHAALALGSARALRRELDRLRPQPTVARLAEAVDALGAAAVQRCREHERAFDHETTHGRTGPALSFFSQGAPS